MSFLSFSDFVKNGLTPYHVTRTLKQILLQAGFEELSMSRPFSIRQGGKYFLTCADASLIAFCVPQKLPCAFQIAAAHNDSPALRITGEKHDGHYVRLTVEKYGGLLCGTWFDRPLSIAGRVFVRKGNKAQVKLLDGERMVVIPSVAPHQNKDANTKVMSDPAVDLLPIFSKDDGDNALKRYLASTFSVAVDDILSDDLYLVNADAPTLWGDDYITAPRLDDLMCVYGLLKGFLLAEPCSAVSVLAVFNSEEIGSMTSEGADSCLLSDTLARVCDALSLNLCKMKANSFMLSADNAHGIHPSHPELFHAGCPCYLNGGIVIKHNAARRYATDGYSAAMVRLLCENASIPVQEYRNRADLPGGSTLGAIANTHLSVPTADIGLSQLAMHAASETGGLLDIEYLAKFANVYFSSVTTGSDSECSWHCDHHS